MGFVTTNLILFSNARLYLFILFLFSFFDAISSTNKLSLGSRSLINSIDGVRIKRFSNFFLRRFFSEKSSLSFLEVMILHNSEYPLLFLARMMTYWLEFSGESIWQPIIGLMFLSIAIFKNCTTPCIEL